MINMNININNLMNFINSNPFLTQCISNQQNINNNTNNNLNINPDNINNINGSQSGILPANTIDNIEKNKTFFICPKNRSKRCRITFLTGTGIKSTVSAPINLPVKDLFIEYIKKMGLEPEILGEKINFLYGGMVVNINENKNISEYGLNKPDVTIVIIDTSSLIGNNN